MSRIVINLASEPFRKDRPLIVMGTLLSVVLTISLIALIVFGFKNRKETQVAELELEKQQARLQKLVNDQSRLEGMLRRPENSTVLERNVFLNQLLLRKAISWTKLFADLESVMAGNVRLVSVRPQVFGQNDVFLDMVVASQSSEPVIQLMMKMEASPIFGVTVMNSLPPSQTDPLYRYRLNATYAQKL
jgi:type IV pilus assembly protein PilN